jgi:hypothetical protein
MLLYFKFGKQEENAYLKNSGITNLVPVLPMESNQQ